MKVYLIAIGLLSLTLLDSMSNPANACTRNSDGTLTPDPQSAFQICKADAASMSFEIIEIGLCSELPDFNQSDPFSSCHSVLTQPFSVDLSIGGTMSPEVVRRPPNGSYPIVYRITSKLVSFKSNVIEFTSDVIGGDGNYNTNANMGKFCTSPNYDVKLDHIWSSPSIRASNCSGTPPAIPSTSVIDVDNLFNANFEPIMSNNIEADNTTEWNFNAASIQNLALLTSANEIATNREEVERILITRKKDSPIEITASTQGIEVEMTLSNSINAYVLGGSSVQMIILNGNATDISAF